MTPRRVMITGGMRSGKSRFAEGLLADQPHVTYIAPGPLPDPASDPEWAERIARHRERRSTSWTTVETTDIAGALRAGAPPFLIDCLGTWLTATIDRLGTWEKPLGEWREHLSMDVENLLGAWRMCSGPAVVVTNEVGWGLVSEHRSGRVFTDLLGELNARFAEASDMVYLLVAGRALRL
jgi:adenosylcobinamide kinase / adenosylcobinamide-phosphate guanylyltransferase